MYSCGKRRLLSDCADAQSDQSLRWPHMSKGKFLHPAAHLGQPSISGENDFRRRRMPIILPFIVTTTISVACTLLTLVKQEGAIYVSFLLFTIYRSYIFSYEVTFINDA